MPGSPTFERFTERARQVCVLAASEARGLRHNYVGAEHILLGLIAENEGIAARVLEDFDVVLSNTREEVERIVGRGEQVTDGAIPYTPRGKKILELALREALSLGHNYIGTEHILLGLVREGDSVAMAILIEFLGEDASNKIRNEVIRALSGPGSRRKEAAPEPDQEPSKLDPHAELSKALRGLGRAIEATPEFRSLVRIAKWFDEKIT